MSELNKVAEAITELVDDNAVDEFVLGDLDFTEVVEVVTAVVAGQLSHLQGLGDDPQANEEALRTAVHTAAIKALLTGYSYGRTNGGPDGVVVPVPPEALEQIGLALIRDGSATFSLVAE